MMLQKLMEVATWDYVPDDIGFDLTTDLDAWKEMQTRIQSLISKQQEVNDLLVTAQVLAKEQVLILPFKHLGQILPGD
jgi:hypothetical protein